MSAGQTVLIVDDEVAIAHGLVLRLEAAGYLTHVCLDGRSALAAVDQHVPDAVILDLSLPDMDGLQFMRHLHAFPALRQIPIIALSGDEARRNSVLAAGACDFLLKPYERETMLAAVRDAVSRSCAASS